MILLLFIFAVVSFFAVFLLLPWFIRYLSKLGLVVKDQNKEGKPIVPFSAGLVVMGGMLAGIMIFLFFETFFPQYSHVLNGDGSLNNLFAGIISIVVITIIGFLDDLLVTSDKERSIGLKQWQKPLLTLIAAVPLMVVNAGTTLMTFPILGTIDLGLLYPLLIVPIGVVGAANMVNMLGGINGIEAGMGLVYTGTLAIYTYYHSSYLGTLFAVLCFFSLLAFFYYNRFPARILPGDSLTYMLGAAFAVIAIVGNVEKSAIILSIPFFFEFLLKARTKFKAQSYGYYKNGKVASLSGEKVYSLIHLFTRTEKFTEKQITGFFILIELVFAVLIWLV